MRWRFGPTSLVGAGSRNSLCVWSSTARRREASLDAAVHSLAFAPDGRILVAGVVGAVFLWDLGAGTPAKVSVPGEVEALAFSPDGALLAAAVSKDIWVFPVQNGKLGHPETRHSHLEAVTALAFLPQPESLVLLSGSRDKTVKVWRIR